MPENNNTILDIRSNEMEEVVGNVPSWIIRWGITALFAVGVLGLLISTFIRYPDTLRANVLMQATDQPGKVTIRRTEANASHLFKYKVKEGDQVKPGDTLLSRYNDSTRKTDQIITPIAGRIYISKGIDEKNTLDQQIWVVPKSTKAEIKLKYPTKGAGRVKVGQIVKIELEDFPSSEYGFIEGRISAILPMQVDGFHQAYVALKGNRVLTSENKEIPILPVMEGDAEIILSDKSIFKRIFGSVFH